MSRLIVKNLPTTITEDKFRKTFSSQGGEVTDVQLKYTKEGKFRHFGFVGFKTDEGAQKAKQYFNNTYIGATKVSVEVCADLGDSVNKPRAWSKYASDSSAYKSINNQDESVEHVTPKKDKKQKKKEKQAKVDALLEKYKDDAKFQEFLNIHKRNATASATWNNDAILDAGKTYEEDEENIGPKANDADKEEDLSNESIENNKVALDEKVSDLDYLKSLSSSFETKSSSLSQYVTA